MSENICDAIVVTCIDFRFHEFIESGLKDILHGKKFDFVGHAGGVKDLNAVIDQIKISEHLHNISEVYLINHEDCGAYGDEGTHERHVTDLKIASNKVTELWPHLDVKLYYLHLDGEFEEVTGTNL